MFAEPVDPEEVRPFVRSSCFVGVANLFEGELLSADDAIHGCSH